MTTSSPRRIVIMGVSGSGKTTVGSALAARLGWQFIDGDALHPPENIAKMSSGAPLTDADRAPWLAAVARELDSDGDAIAACSALRRAYRLAIARAVPGVFFVHLTVPPATLAARMRTREGHFMPTSLLDSQLSTLEPLGPGESGIAIDAARELDCVVMELVKQLTAC